MYPLIMALSICYWMNYVALKPKLQKKSENSVESGRVLRFVFDREWGVVNATVQASMRDRSYKVQISLDDSYGVTDSKCECPLGHFECHHVAAALLYGYKNVSRTDVKCAWLSRPKSARRAEPLKTISEIYPGRGVSSALGRPVTEDDLQFLYGELSKLGRFTGMHWILSPEVSAPAPVVPLVEDILVSEQFLQSCNPVTVLRQQLIVNAETVKDVASATAGQRSNPLWAAVRKLRITASNFGPVLRACRLNRVPVSLKKRLLSSYNLETVRSIAWGVNHESEAILCYTTLGATVEETGIWLHESGILGASPDGIISRPPVVPVCIHYQNQQPGPMIPAVLEVKCPFSARDLTVTEAAASLKDFFLENVQGSLKLKTTHDYFHQIQGQLHIMGQDCCDLAVWTTKDFQIIRIGRDPFWMTNISRLTDFYFNVFLKWFL